MVRETMQRDQTNAFDYLKPFMRPAPFIALLGVLVFWGGILVGERRYPSEFDWRYMTLSTLISPHRNPNGYAWAAGGLILSALSALLWAVALARRRNGVIGQRPRGIWLLEWGSVCMVGSVMLP